jgi:hypothetical protein
MNGTQSCLNGQNIATHRRVGYKDHHYQCTRCPVAGPSEGTPIVLDQRRALLREMPTLAPSRTPTFESFTGRKFVQDRLAISTPPVVVVGAIGIGLAFLRLENGGINVHIGSSGTQDIERQCTVMDHPASALYYLTQGSNAIRSTYNTGYISVRLCLSTGIRVRIPRMLFRSMFARQKVGSS